MKRTLKYTYNFFLYGFALIGLVLVGGFFAIRFHLTDVAGIVDPHSQDFEKMVLGVATEKAQASSASSSATNLSDINSQIVDLAKIKDLKSKNLCKIDAIGKYNPVNAKKILQAYSQTGSDAIANKMIFAAELRLDAAGHSNDFDVCDNQDSSASLLDENTLNTKYADAQGIDVFPWMNDDQWSVIRQAISKDKDEIDQAAGIAGIEPRLIVASAIVEQVRLFHTERGLFKQFFEPLKILGNSNKISLGIMGVKEATAIQTENNLKDPTSPYYLGPSMEHALDFTTNDPTTERYQRLTDENNHYYSYLYGGIYMKEMMQQWKNAGFDIEYRPEIVGTLFNVGFPQSHPNADPKVGGSEIDVGDAKYSFGSLAYEFYYSGELLDQFPFVTN